MSLFRKKINPFCSLTISLGPLYVERVFDSLLTLQGVKDVVRMPAPERFERYLDYLRQKTNLVDHEQFTLIQFYRAHFCQQLANLSKHPEITQHWQEKALCYYQTYLELGIRPDESSFYAQWQTGALQDNLHYPWQMVEESFLKAHTLDPLRGEPIKNLVDHYIRIKEWTTAYSYSAIVLKKHFENAPATNRRWFIDFDTYNWNVVNKHLAICYKLGYMDEVAQTYAQMTDYEVRHLDELKDHDIRHIHSLKKIIRKQVPMPIKVA
jgi:hypothetical protein